MNGFERIDSSLRGNKSDKVPIMLHNFMMAAKESNISMQEYRNSPKQIARCFIEAIEKYSYDGIVVDIDTATLAGAVGVPIEFPENTPARTKKGCLDRLADIRELKTVDIQNYRYVQNWLEATSLLKDYFVDQIFIRGNCDQSPFSLAGLIRGMQSWMMDLLDPTKHDLAHELLEHCTKITTQFVDLMAETGAHGLSNGDSLAGPDMISPDMYKEFALPYQKRVIDSAHQRGLPYILHICGNTNLILSDMISSGADGLELDYKTDINLVHDKMKEKTTFLGNLDPSNVLALGSIKLIEQKTSDLLGVFSDEPRFILNAGCAIPAETPSNNLKAMIKVAREYKI